MLSTEYILMVGVLVFGSLFGLSQLSSTLNSEFVSHANTIKEIGNIARANARIAIDNNNSTNYNYNTSRQNQSQSQSQNVNVTVLVPAQNIEPPSP